MKQICVLALGLVLVACNGSDSDPPADSGVDSPETTADGSTDSSIVSSDSATDTNTDNAIHQQYSVEVGSGGFTFAPKSLTIRVGDTVLWNFIDGSHNVVSGQNCVADNSFCSPSDNNCSTAKLSAAGKAFEHTFTEAGDFPYFCTPHCDMDMTGNIIVTP